MIKLNVKHIIAERAKRLLMICVKSLPLDEEASLYLNTFFHARENAPAPSLALPRHKKMKRSPSVIPFQERVVCYRCGSIGHIASSCTGQLPSLEELEAQRQSDLETVMSKIVATGDFENDEFGLYYKYSHSPISTDQNWKTQAYCINCGEAGHVLSDCRRPKFQDLIHQFGTDNSHISPNHAREIERGFRKVWGN